MSEWIGTLGVVIASGTAIWGVLQWRRQMIAGRRMQIAEEALAAFYEARDIIRRARSPMSTPSEGRTWRGERYEKDDRPELWRTDAYFAPAERLFKEKEFFARLQALQYRFQAVFGPETCKFFQTVWSVHTGVRVASDALVRSTLNQVDGAEGVDKETRKSWEANIWWRDGEDEITNQMDAVVRDVEELCRPVLTKWLSL